MSKIEVQIGANTSELTTKLSSAIKSLDKLKLEQKELNTLFKSGVISSDKYYDSIAKNSIKISRASSLVGKYKSAISRADTGVGAFGKSTANATPALQEFSRVIQDAPFGIMGVGNNIQQLTANFGHLSKSAGGSKAALKAMIGALAGPGGVLLAVSAVTTLLTVFSDEIFSSEKSTKSAKEALEDYVEALNQVDRARVKGTQSAAKELTDLRLLKKQIEDTNIPQADRLKALNKLRDMYPAYLKGMTDEDALAGGLANRYDSLKNAIIEKAKAQAAASIITENEIKKIALENQLLEKQEEILKKRDAASKISKTGTTTSAFGGGGVISNSREKAQFDINDAVNEEKKLKEAIKKIDEDNLKLEERIGKVTEDYGKVNKVNLSNKVSKKSTQDFSKKLAQIDSDIFKEELEGQFKDVDLSGVPISVTPEIDGFDGDYLKIQEGFDEITALEDKLKNLQTTSQVVGQGVGNAFSQMSSNLIGSLGLANSGFEGFIGGLSKTVTDLVAMMLAASISQSIAGATASGTATGPAAVFTTPAFIATAVGGILGAFASIPKFATGTSSYSGDNNLARVNGNEMILQPNQSATLFNALKGGGASLKGGSDKASGWNGEIKGNIVLRGENQKVQLTRADKKFKRFYG